MNLHKATQHCKAILVAVSLAGSLAATPCQAQSVSSELDSFSEATFELLRDTVFSKKPAAPSVYPDAHTGQPVYNDQEPQDPDPSAWQHNRTSIWGVRG